MADSRVGRGRRIFGVGIAAAVLATGAYAYTAANTVEESRAGDGAGTISGYDVSAVEYDLATDPTDIAAVRFTLNHDATTVKAKVSSGGTTYADCSESATANVWECDLTVDNSVLGADELTVIATS